MKTVCSCESYSCEGQGKNRNEIKIGNQSCAEKDKERLDVRSRMRMLRKKETAEEIIANKEKAKTGMQNLRKSKSKEEKEYDKIYAKYKKQ